jgi:membrane protein implicated in regulation of membrane protease activity
MIEWMIPWWGWFIVGFALLLLELSSPGGFYFLFFGVGAISVGILAWLTVVEAAWIELLFFSVFAIVTSLLFRRRLLARFGPKSGDGIVDSLVGEAATVMDNIDAGGLGKVELRGTAWNARNSSDRMLARGERCKVQEVDGLSLIVNKVVNKEKS